MIFFLFLLLLVYLDDSHNSQQGSLSGEGEFQDVKNIYLGIKVPPEVE